MLQFFSVIQQNLHKQIYHKSGTKRHIREKALLFQGGIYFQVIDGQWLYTVAYTMLDGLLDLIPLKHLHLTNKVPEVL